MDLKLIEALAFPIVLSGLLVVALVWIATKRRNVRRIVAQVKVDAGRAGRLAGNVVDAVRVGNLDGAVRYYVELQKISMAQIIGPDVGSAFVEAACCLLDFAAVYEPPVASKVLRELRTFLCRTDIYPMDWITIRLALEIYREIWKKRKRNALVEPFDEFLAFAE